jgi:2-octaprenyl-6-methoxyphenol hydroxylase
MPEQARRYDALVVGGGPSGLAAGLLLARGGVGVAVVAPLKPNSDTRTVALMQPSMQLLKHLALWPGKLANAAQPLRRLTLVDDIGDIFSAPRLTFSAEELGLEAFGWNIPLANLIATLLDDGRSSGVVLINAAVKSTIISSDIVKASLDNGALVESQVVIAADGRNSVVRKACHIKCEEWSYDQSAIATSFAHSAGHNDTSTEFLRPGGPLTTVPLPGEKSSLVWMDSAASIAALMELTDEDFGSELQAAMHGELGLISSVGTRNAFPMVGLLASDFATRRVMLVGEAAHMMPPIGAQGLNISLRDAAMAAELVLDAVHAKQDPGSENVTRNYSKLRRRDVLPRHAIIHSFNRSLLSDFLPFSLARAAGTAVVGQLAPLRRLVMRQGLEPAHLPRTMRT